MDADKIFFPSDNIEYKVYLLKNAGEPIVIIDNYAKNPNKLIDFATSKANFRLAGAAYPGLRASIPEVYPQMLYRILRPIIHTTFLVPDGLNLNIDSSYAIVTGVANALQHNQRVPHTDRNDDYSLAIVHYLCDSSFGGTGFFAQKSTGWARINEKRHELYQKKLLREINDVVLPPNFPYQNHPLFDLIFEVPAKFNRMIIYRSSILHNPAISSDMEFSSNPRDGRLTITSFLSVAPPLPL